jgi:hypothetical protein
MRTLTLVLLAIIVAMSACAHTTSIDPMNTKQCGDLRRKTAHNVVKVALLNRTEQEAQCLLIGSDSTSWLDPGTHELKTVCTAEVMQVELVDRDKGMLEGLGIGLLTGALTGAAMGFADGDDPPGWFSITAGEKAAIGGLVLGGVGGLSGTFVGTVSGHREEFYLLHASSRNAQGSQP